MMLYYTEIALSHREVPEETSLCIYISGCPFRCPECHYPLLQQPDYGDPLREHYADIIDLYLNRASCVCFLGEGGGSPSDREELLRFCAYAGSKGLKTCLYSGRDVCPEPWMQDFDFVKLGSYKKDLGGLDSPATNQRMYRKTATGYKDITDCFREERRTLPKNYSF